MIRVFPRCTKWTPMDELAFVGEPPLFRLSPQDVRVSVTFTWDIQEGKRLAESWARFYPDIQIGGPAFDNQGGEFTPGLFLKKGVTITSRGCPMSCPWCFVPKREGRIRELSIKDGWIVQDNNLLACSRKHIEAVMDMLKKQQRAVSFQGGLDSRLFKDWHRRLWESLKVHEYWFSCDTSSRLKDLERVAKIMDGISINKRRAYTMVGFDGETFAQAEWRLNRVYELGFLPFAQLYQNENRITYSKEWKALARKWSRPAAYRKSKGLGLEVEEKEVSDE